MVFADVVDRSVKTGQCNLNLSCKIEEGMRHEDGWTSESLSYHSERGRTP